MAQRSVQITLSAVGGFANLYTLVKAALGITDDREFPACGQSGSILNDNTTPADCRLEITSDPIDFVPFKRLLPEETYPFQNSSGSYNNTVSIQDKWVKLVDNAGTQMAGTGVVTLSYA